MTHRRFYVNVTDEEGVLQGRFPVHANDVNIRDPKATALHAIGREVVEQLPPGYFDETEARTHSD